MKIGFLAMSGIRAHDPGLLRLGLTLPGFVDRSKIIASLPSLGLLYLAAVTPPGHELCYFEAVADGKEPAEVYTCDLVAISTFSAQVDEAYAIADRLRASGVRVAMGGLHVSALPGEASRHADFVIIGEGEAVWESVVRAAERHEPAQTFRADDFPVVDVAALPVPRFDLLDDRPYNRFTVQTSRGCPWRCEFCASTVMLRKPYRKRPIKAVMRDIDAVLALRPNPFFEFADDNTFVDKAWGRRLCTELAARRVKWFTETDISVADDELLLKSMADAGCRQVLIGLESPDEASLRGVELRSDFKARRSAGYADAIRRIQSFGITVNGCFVLGLDGHTTDIFESVADFADEVGLYDVQITVQTAFPGTPLYERLHREGRLLKPDAWSLCTLFDVNYRPLGMSPEELSKGMRWLTGRLYSEEATDRRRRRFFDGVRSSHRAARQSAQTHGMGA
jgi:radical SAM superfamily enzyme YgiQ (UPF0313 family)